jgi:hypothetical protein
MLPLLRTPDRLRRNASRAPDPRPRRHRRHRPELDALEGRQLLSIGNEFAVNTTTQNDQITAANASSTSGRSVVVWAHRYSATDLDLRGRLYKDGVPLGNDFAIDLDLDNAFAPSVAMDAQGNFVLTYKKEAGNELRAVARQIKVNYDVPAGATPGISVGPVLDFGKGTQVGDIASDAAGNFVVVYTANVNSPTLTADLVARRYSASGAFLGFANTQSSTVTDDYLGSVDMLPDGRFAISYTYEYENGPFNRNVWATMYDKDGNLQWGRDVANTSALEWISDIGLDGAGNAVVSYTKNGPGGTDILARRLGASGAPLTGEIRVSPEFQFDEGPTLSHLAVNRNSGAFVVAYQHRLDLTRDVVSVVEVSSQAAGNVSTLVQAGFATAYHPSVSMDGDGDYLVTYTRPLALPAGTGSDIFGRRGRRT